MPTATETTYTCDACLRPVEPNSKLVEMGEYGLAFHPACFVGTSGPEMLRLMGCDTTLVREFDDEGGDRARADAVRVRDPRKVRPDGTVEGRQEFVPW